MRDSILLEIKDSVSVKEKLYNLKSEIEKIEKLIRICQNALEKGKKIIFCGNGGSFADSQHLTAEFVSRLRFDRSPLSAICLGTNSSNLSAISNDYGYEKVFERELVSLARQGDVFIPISTSGNSKNIICAINQAQNLKLKVFGFTGEGGGEMAKICDTINVPSNSTEKIQECHIMIGHIICYLIEKEIFYDK